jgi:hypothetical protein
MVASYGDARRKGENVESRPISGPSRDYCKYPQSNALAGDMKDALENLAANRSNCSRFYLDTVESMSGDDDNHHQALARVESGAGPGVSRAHRLRDDT